MFSEVELARNVVLCPNHFESGQPLHQLILEKVLRGLMDERSCEEHGFFLGITAVKSIGEGKKRYFKNVNDDNDPGIVVTVFLVSFMCRTFLPVRGEIMEGIVDKVFATGVFISSGPLRYAYLSAIKMPRYRYVPASQTEEEPYFLRDDLSRIAVGVVVRFKVLAVRFKQGEERWRDNEFYVLAYLEGNDTLGPVSLAGSEDSLI
ncbi:unnamed protein product [Microthlaspi erraticum]|uniref:DNA-directed RNA polymerase subunit n=1 Tax=Microthlaspi erraticum TaxID=1685480 RepID=A0A6D2IR77_9BRAS|nr:unnamed protein product [Microthlaspi erraticum]